MLQIEVVIETEEFRPAGSGVVFLPHPSPLLGGEGITK
jgi:hypothetical protein